MALETPPLSSKEKQQAHALWKALMFAPSRPHLEQARQDLKDATPNVRSAILKANVHLWRERKEANPGQNPFD